MIQGTLGKEYEIVPVLLDSTSSLCVLSGAYGFAVWLSVGRSVLVSGLHILSYVIDWL